MFCNKISRKIIGIFAFLLYLCFNHIEANALFARDYQKALSIGAYKRMYTSDIYIITEVGLTLYNANSNIATALLGNSNLPSYANYLQDDISKTLKGRYTYYIKAGLGFNSENSNFRHELYFQWYSFASKSINMSQATTEIITNGITNTYNYALINDTLATSVGMYGTIYKIMYGLNYDFRNVFNLLKMDWDLYIGFGFGLAIIYSGIYAGGEIQQKLDANGAITGETYKDNKVNSATDASKYKIVKQSSLGLAYSVHIGTIVNISQSFAANIGFSFNATTKPLLTTSFKTISGASGVKSHLEYNAALNLGILIKAFEIRN